MLTQTLEKILLTRPTPLGERLEATFLPNQGMNFISYKKDSIEVIDQSTIPLFEDHFAGLGAMIGPHFYHRDHIPSLKDESLFPHIARLKAQGTKEPFSHGIGRYAPWRVEEVTESSLKATLKGSDEWRGVKLKDLEGQDFVMHYSAQLQADGLRIELSVASDLGSIVGLHTYYTLAQGKGKVSAKVTPICRDKNAWKPIPSSWNYYDHTFIYMTDQPIDAGFIPFPDPLNGEIFLETQTHHLKVSYSCDSEENSFQIWHPEGASFVCIEPLTARNPQNPQRSISKIDILISIV